MCDYLHTQCKIQQFLSNVSWQQHVFLKWLQYSLRVTVYYTAPLRKIKLFFQTRSKTQMPLLFETKAYLHGGLAITMATQIADFNSHESYQFQAKCCSASCTLFFLGVQFYIREKLCSNQQQLITKKDMYYDGENHMNHFLNLLFLLHCVSVRMK